MAGYTEVGETLEQTVHREVMEEVGLKVKNLRYYKSQPWSFSGSLLAGFYCDVDGDPSITLDREELSVAEWFDRASLPGDPEPHQPDRRDDRMLPPGERTETELRNHFVT